MKTLITYDDNFGREELIIPLDKNYALFQSSYIDSNNPTQLKLYNNKRGLPYIYDSVHIDTNPSIGYKKFPETNTPSAKRHGIITVADGKLGVDYSRGNSLGFVLKEFPNYKTNETQIFPLTLDAKNNPIILIANKDKVGLISTTTAWAKHHLLKKLKSDSEKELEIGVLKEFEITEEMNGRKHTKTKKEMQYSKATIGEILNKDSEHFDGKLKYLYGFTYEQLNKMLPGKRKIPKGAKFFDNYDDYKKLEDIYTNNTFIPYKTEDGKHGILLEDSVNITGLDLDNIDAVVSHKINNKKSDARYLAIHTKDNKVNLYYYKEGDSEAILKHTFENIYSINRVCSEQHKDNKNTADFLMQTEDGEFHELNLDENADIVNYSKHFEQKLKSRKGYYRSKMLLGKFNEEDAKNFLKDNCK